MALATLLLATSGIAVSAVNAVVTGPANVHAARSSKSAVIGTIRAAETIKATKCRNGWCAAAGGYVRSAKLSFARAGKSERVYEGYDYNVPLALPPYGYTPGFWVMVGGATTTSSAITRNTGRRRILTAAPIPG